MQYDRNDVLTSALEQYGRDTQIDMMIEEMSELAKALMKYRRHVYDDIFQREVQEEIADVQIVLDQMKILFGATDRIEAEKIARLFARLGMGGYEQ